MWKQEKVKAQLREVEAIKDHVVISGGLAWHLMSPPHEEHKLTHDHKDVDLFVFPSMFPVVIKTLKNRGFEKYWTKYDGLSKDFYRYGLTTVRQDIDKPYHVKVLFDIFVEEVPWIQLDEFKVVEPGHLLSLYETTHSSKECYAVQAAMKLVKKGISPIGREELIRAGS